MTTPNVPEGHYTVNRDGDRIWVGSSAAELAYHTARADILASEITRLQVYVQQLEAELLACKKGLS